MGLPRAYDRWLGDWLGGELPNESLATCHSCAMQAPEGVKPSASEMYFGPAKCCTYYPSLPNFQVGGILRDAQIPEGARRIANKIASRVNVDPLCVRADRRRAELYKIGVSAGFGRAEAFRCPYYNDGGGCSIWPYREAVCSTYYCKLDRPVKGRELWSSLKSLLHILESTVVIHCAIELGISSSVIDELSQGDSGLKSPADVDAVPDPAAHAKLWGNWLDREEEYYRACADIAEKLDLAAIRKLGGIAFERKLAAFRTAYDAMSTALPERLRAAPMLQITPSQPGTVQIHASANHPVQMPAVIIEVLSYFQGQPVRETSALLEAQGFEVQDGFVERLYDYGFLIDS